MHLLEKAAPQREDHRHAVGHGGGGLLCRPVVALEAASHQMITPTLIFMMLFVTFCRVSPKQMKPSMLHLWLLLVQIVLCLAVYLLLAPLNEVVAQGAGLHTGPLAMAAVVIGGMLGANVATMATLQPALQHGRRAAGSDDSHLHRDRNLHLRADPRPDRSAARRTLCRRAVLRFVFPKLAQWIGEHGQISFYMWLMSLIVIIGRTTSFIIDLHDASISTELWLAFCGSGDLPRAVQDRPHAGTPLRRRGGRRTVARAEEYGAGGVDGPGLPEPVSSIAPTAYIAWQTW